MDDKLAAFLQSLWRGAPYSNFWRLADKQVQWFPTFPQAENELGDTNVYMSVHGCKAERSQYERTRVEDVACINALFAEWDTKDWGGDDDQLRAHIRALPIQPQVIVSSGGGYHGYFFVDEPMPMVTPAVMDYIAVIQAAFVRMVGGDPGAKDLARVLRLPGTFNGKYAPKRRASFARFDLVDAARFKLNDLCALAEPFWGDETTTLPEPTLERGQHNGAIAAIVKTFRAAHEGERNKMLLWAACKMLEHGMTLSGVQSELLPVALSIGLDEPEILSTIRSASKQPARAPEPYQRFPTRSRSLNEATANLARKYQS